MKKSWIILFCISLPLLIILFSYKITLFFTPLEVNQQQTINYLEGGELQLNYTSAEVSHLKDVKGVIRLGDYLFYFSLLMVTLIITYHKKKKEEIKKLLFYGGISTVSFLLLMLIISIFNFDFVFAYFHKIFFPQGNWQFATESLLIQTFPREFFVEFSRMMFRISIILGGILLIFGKRYKRRK